MSNTQSLNDLLGGGGPPIFKFETIGDTIVGALIGAKEVQQTDIKTQEPLFWPGGKPRMQLVITLRLDSGEENRVFMKPQWRAALKKAVEDSGTDFALGARVAIKYERDEPSDKPGLDPQKIAVVAYKAPEPAMDASNLL